MTDREPAETTNLDRYGNPALEWSRVVKEFERSLPAVEITCFLGTVSADGRPHAAGIGANWFHGDIYFTSSPKALKARNLIANDMCTISGRFNGIDVVAEGTAMRVTDRQTLEQVVERYRERGWPAEVEGDAFTAPFSAPSAGAPPWYVYRFRLKTVFGVAGAEPYGATRWRFEEKHG
jgi:hypothetical protein